MLNVTIADYGVGNLHSLRRALERCGANVEVTSDMRKVTEAECIAFPGVGAFDKVMESILPEKDDILDRLRSGIPCLGICIGMQILMDGSDEGRLPGLGFINGRVERYLRWDGTQWCPTIRCSMGSTTDSSISPTHTTGIRRSGPR